MKAYNEQNICYECVKLVNDTIKFNSVHICFNCIEEAHHMTKRPTLEYDPTNIVSCVKAIRTATGAGLKEALDSYKLYENVPDAIRAFDNRNSIN